ncbi:MAG TPA: hypothetical protein DCX71_14250 [Erythrobacter sp.]|jgi:hypothetical protein|nr:hypothetical protein [Erythrobacter sp.]HAW37213.1 hypothetical protein [Erythrobacter sp.]|tara:strand:+ start:1770 stop:2072 length:303 start_codon:yes stop_codon:yes gene_type:complete
MAISRPNVVSFRLSAKEYRIIKKKAGAMSVADYVRRSALNLDAADRTAERVAIGKTIRAIHKAIDGGLPNDRAADAKALLADALCIVEPSQPESAKRISS